VPQLLAEMTILVMSFCFKPFLAHFLYGQSLFSRRARMDSASDGIYLFARGQSSGIWAEMLP